MQLIIGLGNPEKKYKNSRHNAGYIFLDFLQKKFNCTNFVSDKKTLTALATGTIDGVKTLLVKPEVAMNHSGTALLALLQFYKLSPSDMIVVHDDLDIAPGTYKTTLSSRAAGHNGVQHIIDTLKTQYFFRVRLGIGHPDKTQTNISSAHFVLDNFSTEEREALTALFPKVTEALLLHQKKRFALAPKKQSS